MTNEMKPVRCGCGGNPIICKGYAAATRPYYVYCFKCKTTTRDCISEAEAIEIWNKAMGAKDINVPDKFATDIHVGNKERTAKVEGNRCTACDNHIRPCMKYCDYCGARLEWK